MTPGVSILVHAVSRIRRRGVRHHSRLALEIFHNVQEPIVYIGLIVELDLNLIQVGEGVLKRIKC